jgi:muramoyltetrapeptide carboxypeptidase
LQGKIVSPAEVTPLEAIKPGSATAPVIPCCLSVLMAMIGTPWMPDLSNTILVLESIGLDAYNVERCLTQLEQCGILQRLSGLVFGCFTNCDKREYLPEIFRDYAAQVPGPVCCNFKFGHEEPGAVIHVGGTAALSVEASGNVLFG